MFAAAVHRSGKHGVIIGNRSSLKHVGRSLQQQTTNTTTSCTSTTTTTRSSMLRLSTTTTAKKKNHKKLKTTSLTSSLSKSKKAQQQQQQPRRFSTDAATAASEEVATEPGFHALRIVALTQAIPFIGFGFMDNAILIVAGDWIDTRLGVVFGISTLCAAAIGNIVSDLAGIGMGTIIEDFCANYLRLPVVNLTAAQRKLRSVRFAGQLGMAVGMTFGCIVGMFPLLWIDSDKIPRLKQKAKVEALFRDVVTEAKTLVGAESTLLYLRVDKEPVKEPSSSILPYKPNGEGDTLYAMFYDVPENSSVFSQLRHRNTTKVESDRTIPLGKGIVSRAMLTGLAWKIDDVKSEPDFYPDSQEQADHMRQMLVVPVLDGQGRVIAAIRAMNKVDGVFTDQDVLILKSLASHISVSLQSMYQDQEDDDARLRDTIRILKEHGIEGLQDGESRRARLLFPDID